MGANTTDLYAAWEEEGSGGTHVACYAGLFGRCHECDIAGSCICGKYRNGMSDFVPMDRREFGQRVLLCPNLEPVLIILYSVACLAALILLPQTISGVRFQLRQARSQTSANHPRAPLVVMSTALAGTVSILVFSAMKLILPDRVVGADPIISFVLAVRHAASAVGFEAHLTHLVNVARASQERSLGRQRVADAMARRFRLSFVKALIFSVISTGWIFQSVLSGAGVGTSVEAQTAFAVAYALTEAVRVGSSLVLLRIEARTLLASFTKSIDAAHVSASYCALLRTFSSQTIDFLKRIAQRQGPYVQHFWGASVLARSWPWEAEAGYIVAAGGAAQRPFVVQTATESGPTGSQSGQHRPAHLQALLNELESLETAHENVRKACAMMSSALLKAFMIWVVIAAVPPIWSRISYIIPVHSLSWLIPSIGLVKLYGCKRTTRNSARVQRV